MTGCNVSYYQLSYRSLFREENGFPSNETLAILFPVVNNEIIVCELRVHILYNFAIAAVNEAGSGPTTAIRIYHYDPRFRWVVSVHVIDVHMHVHAYVTCMHIHNYTILIKLNIALL